MAAHCSEQCERTAIARRSVAVRVNDVTAARLRLLAAVLSGGRSFESPHRTAPKHRDHSRDRRGSKLGVRLLRGRKKKRNLTAKGGGVFIMRACSLHE